jgi:hypothetical protein
MNTFQILLAVVSVNIVVLGVGFLLIYGFNGAVRQSGR